MIYSFYDKRGEDAGIVIETADLADDAAAEAYAADIGEWIGFVPAPRTEGAEAFVIPPDVRTYEARWKATGELYVTVEWDGVREHWPLAESIFLFDVAAAR